MQAMMQDSDTVPETVPHNAEAATAAPTTVNPVETVDTPQTTAVDTGINQMLRDTGAAWPGVFGTTGVHELGHAGTADLLGSGYVPDPDDPDAIAQVVEEHLSGDVADAAANTPETLGDIKQILTENESYDVAGDWENTNLGDGPVIEAVEETSVLADNDSYDWSDGVTDPLNRENPFGYAQYTGSDQGHWFVDAATTAGSWLQSVVPPALTLWADDNEKKIGRRLGATASSTIAAEQAVTGYHLGPIASMLGASTATVSAAAAAPFLALGLYNGKKMVDWYRDLQKQEDLETMVDTIQETPRQLDAANTVWSEYVDTAFTADDYEAWGNADNYTILDAVDRFTEAQETYEELREERSLLDNLNPLNWEDRRMRKQVHSMEDTLRDVAHQYMDEHGDQLYENEAGEPGKNNGETAAPINGTTPGSPQPVATPE